MLADQQQQEEEEEHLVPAQEVEALAALYDASGGETWTWRSNEEMFAVVWNFTVDEITGELLSNPCSSSAGSTWQGVSCTLPPVECSNQTCSITELTLAQYNLTGTIPPELGNLSRLEFLDLDNNQLTGPIHPELGNLLRLVGLYLSNNQLTGPIPPELGNLSRLEFLDLDNNQLTGPIPPELGNLSGLVGLYLSNNQLDGTILPELGRLSRLEWLFLSNNQLTGTIPPELGNLSRLKWLYLLINQLTGTIPPELGNLSRLEWLDLSNNQLAGTIPPELGNLSRLESLFLSSNQLVRTIHSELGNLSRLESLFLANNQLTVTIPPELGNLSRLEILELDNNQLTGPIPPELGHLSRLVGLHLFENQLTGTIPPELENFSRLVGFYLFKNQLTGTIPPELGNLSRLEWFDLSNNQLAGTISPELGNLSRLESLYLFNNQLTGTIPPELGNLSRLEWLNLSNKQLAGTIPPELGNLSRLESLYLSNNQLTGTIPPELGNLSRLGWLNLDTNYLSGTIPPELRHMSNLRKLEFELNRFTGTIPSELGHLFRLTLLTLNNNLFTGTISPHLGNLRKLEWLVLDDNQLSGTIPSILGSLSTLESLRLNYNVLTGSIPPELGNLIRVEMLLLHENQLIGTLPPEFGNISLLYWLDVSRNQIAGYLPPTLSHLTRLNIIDFSENALSGSLPPELQTLRIAERISLFGNRFTGVIPSSLSELTSLNVFDVGDNLLTGTVPPELEQLSQMKSFVLSVNCLDNLIPESICGMRSVEVLSLNGLGSADDCANQYMLPFESTLVYGGDKDGTIPDCIWSLPNLTLFHAAGNRLVGHIRDGQQAAPNTRIADLIVSHNILDGSIPFVSDLLQHLDVSHNRLTGELTDTNSVNVSLEDTSMIALVNRLSGRVPVAMKSVSDLNVLSGNMMSCETVPSNDVHSEGYSCGSSQYDTALYFAGCSVCITVVVIAIMFSTRSSLRQLQLQPEFMRFKCEEIIRRWCCDLTRYRNFYLTVSIVILLAFSPFLILRILDDDNTHSTHWHIYSWIVSYAFASGSLMGYLIVAMWAIAMLLTWCHVLYNVMDVDRDSVSRQERAAGSKSSDAQTTFFRSWVTVGVSFAANFVVTVGVNTLYVLSVTEASLSQSATLIVQLGMSLFRIVSSAVLVPWLSKQVPSVNRRIFFRLRLLLFNNLVVPCLVTSLTSSNCFQRLIVPPDPVESTYSYPVCSVLTVFADRSQVCTSYETLYQDTPPFTPRFVYNYQCMSTLLAAYIPVLLIGFGIQLLLTAAAVVALELQVIRFEAVPGAIRPVLHGLLWPQYWISRALEIDECPAQKPSQLLRADSIICSDLLNPLALLLTFGLSSPPLAALITLVVVSRMTMWRWAVFRFVSAVKSAGDRLEGRCDELLVKLSEACTSLDAPISWSFSMLAALSMMFSVFMLWDTTAEVSWEVPLLALFLVMFTAGALRCRGRIANLKHMLHADLKYDDERVGSCLEMGELNSITVNALHEGT